MYRLGNLGLICGNLDRDTTESEAIELVDGLRSVLHVRFHVQ